LPVDAFLEPGCVTMALRGIRWGAPGGGARVSITVGAEN
jgi:hypothetical protein